MPTQQSPGATGATGPAGIAGAVGATGVAGIGSVGATGATGPSAALFGANPVNSIGLNAVDGVATTYMRSDAAPAIDTSIAPTWSGIHTFSNQIQMTDGTNTSRIFQFTNGPASLALMDPNGVMMRVNTDDFPDPQIFILPSYIQSNVPYLAYDSFAQPFVANMTIPQGVSYYVIDGNNSTSACTIHLPTFDDVAPTGIVLVTIVLAEGIKTPQITLAASGSGYSIVGQSVYYNPYNGMVINLIFSNNFGKQWIVCAPNSSVNQVQVTNVPSALGQVLTITSLSPLQAEWQ